jgi:hypothetical protein
MTKKLLTKYHQIEIVDVLNSIIRAIIRELGVKTHPANDKFDKKQGEIKRLTIWKIHLLFDNLVSSILKGH